MRVLSMFDGISCGQVALDRIGIMPEVYFASEIDKYAERVSADNWPDIVRLGDAKGLDEWDLGRIDLLLGGSPCTNWSITKKEKREITAGGIGWELFSIYEIFTFSNLGAQGNNFCTHLSPIFTQ